MSSNNPNTVPRIFVKSHVSFDLSKLKISNKLLGCPKKNDTNFITSLKRILQKCLQSHWIEQSFSFLTILIFCGSINILLYISFFCKLCHYTAGRIIFPGSPFKECHTQIAVHEKLLTFVQSPLSFVSILYVYLFYATVQIKVAGCR